MCKLSLLATRGPFRVDVCDECGCVHLHLGAVSIRLDEVALGTLSEVLAEARRGALDAHRAVAGWARAVEPN